MREPFLRTKNFLLSALLIISALNSYSQTVVDGSRLVYARIDSITAFDNNNVDSVFVHNTDGLSVNDTILIFQTLGVTPIAPGNVGEGNAQSLWNTGRYTIVKIKEVLPGQNLVVLNTRLVNFNADYHEGEVGQLIKIPSYHKARITSSLSVPAWDPASKTGGVFPVIVSQKLVLETDLRLDAKGFPGASPVGNYQGPCSSEDISYQEPYYSSAAIDTAALKGEGIVKDAFPCVRGYGNIVNGGGGGSGKYSGGGGGANIGQGGKGGNESDACLVPGTFGGTGGQSLQGFTSANPGDLYYNRIFMGGGGGTGTQNLSASRVATKGGNGGGIILIIADTVVANNHTISSNGEAVEDIATAGAGGGGAGGTIIFDAGTIVGDLFVEAKGGQGGNTLNAGQISGPGGGGGGGAIWYSGSSVPPELNINLQAGLRGTANDVYAHGSLPGSPGKVFTNLLVPVNGFLLNFMPDDQTICENEVPKLIDAPLPRGGDGTYSYLWQQSFDGISWSDATGTNNEIAYQPPALNDTMWYRRIVDDGILPPDTSFSLTIHVHPSIEDNIFISGDSICFNTAPEDLVPLASIRGGLGPGTYSYSWQQSEDMNNWMSAPGNADLPSYDPPALSDTTWYQRIVRSGVCKDTSNLITITVFDTISNNLIAESQEVCNNQIPDPLNGTSPSGGLPGDKRYQWQVDEGSGWNDIVQTKNYAPGSLGQGTYNYRRIVYSGMSNECIDTSANVTVISWPDISNNILISSDTTICAELPSVSLSGSQPLNGSGSYTYRWQYAEAAGGQWHDDETMNTNEIYKPGTLNEDHWFRRLVYSGEGNVCADTTSEIKISVLPVINSNIISDDQLICEGFVPSELSGTEVSGGAGSGSYGYQWQSKTIGSEFFSDVSVNGDEPEYSFQPLSDSTRFRRLVFSGPNNTCSDTSNTVDIDVLPAIQNNLITGSPEKEVCRKENINLPGADAEGGNGSYDFLWQVSENGADWNPAPSDNSQQDYIAENVTSPLYFRRMVHSLVCSDTSAPVFIDTLSLPVLTRMTVNRDSICHLEKNFRLELQISNGHEPFSVSYMNGVNAEIYHENGVQHAGHIPVASFPQSRQTYTFSLLSVTDSKGCMSEASNLDKFTASMELFPDAEPEILLQDKTEVCDNLLNINANADIADHYWWSVSNSSISISDSSETSTSATVNPGFNRQSGWLTFHASSPGCMNIHGYTPSVDSVYLTFYEQPEVLDIPEETNIIYLVDQYWIHYDASDAGDISWSVTEGGGEFSNITRDSAFVSAIPEETRSTFRATLSNGVCESLNDEISVERRDVHVYEGISPNEDMINDFLVAEGLDAEQVDFNFQVFANNGLLVRTVTNEDISKLGFRSGLAHHGLELWDGKAADEQTYVPQGVYYYVLQIIYKGQNYSKKGFVVVKE